MVDAVGRHITILTAFPHSFGLLLEAVCCIYSIVVAVVHGFLTEVGCGDEEKMVLRSKKYQPVMEWFRW